MISITFSAATLSFLSEYMHSLYSCSSQSIIGYENCFQQPWLSFGTTDFHITKCCFSTNLIWLSNFVPNDTERFLSSRLISCSSLFFFLWAFLVFKTRTANDVNTWVPKRSIDKISVASSQHIGWPESRIGWYTWKKWW